MYWRPFLFSPISSLDVVLFTYPNLFLRSGCGHLFIGFRRAHSLLLGKVRFLINFFLGGGGRRPGLWMGGSLVNFLQIGEGQTCFILNRGRVTVFLVRKKLLHFASILYIQAKLPVKINVNYLQVSKNLYIKKLSSPN